MSANPPLAAKLAKMLNITMPNDAAEAIVREIQAAYAKGLDDGVKDFEAIVLPAAVAAEREACAMLCDEVDKDSQSQWPKRLATMIRARGQS